MPTRKTSNSKSLVVVQLAGGNDAPTIYSYQENWNGTAWTELGDLTTSRWGSFGGGAGGGNQLVGGGTTGSVTDATEQWAGGVANKTITVS